MGLGQPTRSVKLVVLSRDFDSCLRISAGTGLPRPQLGDLLWGARTLRDARSWQDPTAPGSDQHHGPGRSDQDPSEHPWSLISCLPTPCARDQGVGSQGGSPVMQRLVQKLGLWLGKWSQEHRDKVGIR